jgi:hypothetical protein
MNISLFGFSEDEGLPRIVTAARVFITRQIFLTYFCPRLLRATLKNFNVKKREKRRRIKILTQKGEGKRKQE